jgi:hypothetical protein
MTRKSLVRLGVGATALLAAGAFASPAYADTTADLEIKVTGTTIAAGADGKFTSVSLLNHGPSDAAGVLVTLDISALDQTKVHLGEEGCDPPAEDKILCGIEGDVIANGQDIDWTFPLEKVPGATGSAGQLTATISHAGEDPNPANNSVTVDVAVGGNGPDLLVIAEDVYAANEQGVYTGEAVAPGEDSVLWVYVENDGDTTANGVRMQIDLPEHVSFAEAEPDCTHAVGDGATTCIYETAVLVPVKEDTDENDEIFSFGWFFFPVTVAEDAPSPATLKGVASAEALPADPQVTTLSRTAAVPPVNMTQEGPADVDPSDNTDDFTVFVGEVSGSGGGSGGLPVTGARAGLIGGVGAAALALGAVLFVAARRRRIVLTAPVDDA